MIQFHAVEADISVDGHMMKVVSGDIMQSANLDTERMKPAPSYTNRGNLINSSLHIPRKDRKGRQRHRTGCIRPRSIQRRTLPTANSRSASGGNDNYVQRDAFHSLLTALMPCK